MQVFEILTAVSHTDHTRSQVKGTQAKLEFNVQLNRLLTPTRGPLMFQNITR